MTTDPVPDGARTSLFSSVSRAFQLLTPRDRRILLLLIIVQIFLALLDLFGVALIGIVVLVSSSTLTGTAPTGLAAQVLERLPVGSDPYVTAAILATCAGLLLIAKSLLSYFVTRRTFRFLANRQAMIASDLASALLSRPLLYVQERSSQDTASTLTRSVSQLTMGVLGGAVIVVSESALLILLISALAFVDLTVTIFAAVFFAGVAFAVQRVLANWATSIGERSYRAEVASLTAVQEAIRSYREISVAGRRGSYVNRFRGFRWEVAAAEADLRLVNIVTKYIYEVALVVGGGLLAVSQFVTKDTTAAVTILAIFLVAATRLLPSVMRLQTAAFTIRASASESQDALAMHESLKDLPRLDEDEFQGVSDRALAGMAAGYPGFDGSVNVTDCTLWYPGASEAALESVELVVPPGGSVALVGTTGAGKSTLADVILGVLAPDTGAVLVSGVPPGSAVSTWPGALAYVPQDVTIIEGSVRSNVAIGLSPDHVDDELVWESLERAHLADFLREAREGLDTVVGEAGVRLSGGQRQRLGIARALYTRPRLVVLDEATSALDAETERLVTDTLAAMEGDVTIVVIAHRLATIRSCDQVVYLEAGRVRARGTFDDVASMVPDFHRQAHLLGLT